MTAPTAAAAPARVDVLALIDDAQDLLGQMGYSQTANALIEAHAAFAALLDAARDVQAWGEGSCALDAAIARFGGAA